MAATACAVVVAFAGAAEAQLGDVGEQTQVDTDSTPRAKESTRWSWYAGAKYRTSGPEPADVPAESVTPFELDLFDVAFRDPGHGVAGGAVCRSPAPAGDPDAAKTVRDCERVPALWEYSPDAAGDGAWREVDLGDRENATRGYVGAVAWLDSEHALAVGGTGCYPRREEPCPGGRAAEAPNAGDPIAGRARAWLYQDWEGSGKLEWRELTGLPEEMRGLSALGAPAGIPPRREDCDEGEGASAVTTAWGCAVAGGLRQLWHFRDGRFVRGLSGDGSTAEAPERGELLQFRIRDVKFVAYPAAPPARGQGVRALAMTAGCCAADPLRNGPRLIFYDGSGWHVRSADGDPATLSDDLYVESRRRPVGDQWDTIFEKPQPLITPSPYDYARARAESGCVTPTLCPWSKPTDVAPSAPTPQELTGTPWPVDLEDDPENPAQSDAADQSYGSAFGSLDRAVSPYGANVRAPDSYYALARVSPYYLSGESGGSFAGIASPGGPTRDAEAAPGGDEGPSALVEGSVRFDRRYVPGTVGSPRLPTPPSQLTVREVARPPSTARLVSADATPVAMNGRPLAFYEALGRNPALEAVGVLRSSGQGIAWGPGESDPKRGTLGTPLPVPDPGVLVGCDLSTAPSFANSSVPCDPQKLEPSADRYAATARSLHLFALPSYALNAVDVLDDPLENGAGWAVGDHGAILSLAGETGAQAQLREPKPPQLGAPAEGPLPDTSPYDSHRQPPNAEPGTVPPFGAGEAERLDEPRFVLRSSFRMESAIQSVKTIVMSRDGSEGWALGSSIFYFDGVDWRHCPRGGAPGAQAGRTCPDLGPLKNAAAEVRAAARIPLEQDDEPSNDDELAVFAYTTAGVARYDGGRWRSEQGRALGTGLPGSVSPSRGLLNVVFVAPDDGWATGGTSAIDMTVYRWDGERWTNCRPSGGGGKESPVACADPEGRLTGSNEFTTGVKTGTFSNDRGFGVALAGERVYLFATRSMSVDGSAQGAEPIYPMIVYRDRGGAWKGSADGSDGGFDPGFYARAPSDSTVPPVSVDSMIPNPTANRVDPRLNALRALSQSMVEDGGAQGRLYSVAVEPDGSGFTGWAVGEFGGRGSEARAVLMRLEDGAWKAWPRIDAGDDYLRVASPVHGLQPQRQLSLAEPLGRFGALAFPLGEPRVGANVPQGEPPVGFNEATESWEALDAPFISSNGIELGQWKGTVDAVAPTGRGGAWVLARQRGLNPGATAIGFYEYTDRAPPRVLGEVASPAPAGQPLTAATAGADGSFWLATESNVLYRHDRLTGWDSVRIPGWDPGRTVTNPSPVRALAVGADGRGVAVGPGGRIANFGPRGAKLDAAAGTACDLGAPAPPCGTGRPLSSAAVGPDGSALVAGDSLSSLLWRPAGGEFRLVAGPARQSWATRVAAVALPRGDRAYLLLGNGRLYAGELEDQVWSWRLELEAAADPDVHGIRAFVVAEDGHGYALPQTGGLLERTGDGERPWRRLGTGYERGLNTLAIPPGGGPGLLAGGEHGAVFTLQGDRLALAQPGDPFAPINGSHWYNGSDPAPEPAVVGLGLMPGSKPGQVEAWAAVQDRPGFTGHDRRPPAAELLRYTSEPALDPARLVEPLPDAVPPRAGEIVFAAFGKQDCQGKAACVEVGGNRAHAVIARRITEELLARAARPGGPSFAVFTGDQSDAPAAGRADSSTTSVETPLHRDLKQPRWAELVAGRLTAGGLPAMGGIGGQDLALTAEACTSFSRACAGARGTQGIVNAGGSSRQELQLGAGSNGQWRAAMALAPAPWTKERVDAGALRFERVFDPLSQPTPDVAVKDANGETLEPRPSDQLVLTANLKYLPRLRAELARGSATHYAFDALDAASGRKVARFVVVDTSMRSLAASDAQQEPQEPGGQRLWLERMVCMKGGPPAGGGECTREAGQQAIVVSNTPTYSQAPIDPTLLQQDAAEFESILIRHRANLVVSGRLGWMGRYWALAPGVHSPCAGEAYRDEPPPVEQGVELCGQGGGDEAADRRREIEGLAAELQGAAAPALPDDARAALETKPWTLPFVISSAAGGKLAEAAERGGLGAEDGFWHGYQIVRLDPSGDPRATIVEQRPVLDWIAIRSQEHVLRPGQRMTLRGYGRQAYGQDKPARYIDFDSPAVTHRYDVVLADPEKPWLPFEDANGDYVPVPPSIATLDRQTGALKTGRGTGKRTFAVAILSVGDKAASRPLVFEPRRSFVSQRAKTTLPALPRPARAPAAQPPIRLTEAAPPPPPPPPATPASPISSQTLQPPQPPQIPSLPSISAAAPPAPPTLAAPPPPPAPPAPPPVPPQQQPSPLALGAKVQAVAIVPSVNPPAPPPVNPAPPGGAAARKEAKQRQAATAKSEESGGSEATEAGGDLADGPSNQANAMTRRAPTRPVTSFSVTAREPGPSAWSRGALYGGGLGLAAAALALGFSILRPRPRRRPPEVPAPAWARSRSWR